MIEFWIARQDGTFTKAEGEPLRLSELPELEFVVHRYDEEWRVSEKSSGLCLSKGSAAQYAIDTAIRKLEYASTKDLGNMRFNVLDMAKKQADWLFADAVKQAEALSGGK